jgi:serine/threonine protein kinase
MSMTTTLLHETRTLMYGGEPDDGLRDRANELLEHYMRMIHQPKLGWTEHLRLRRQLGHGGQGIVYLSERRGADNFTLPVALKFFSPERFPDERGYREAMERMAQVSSRVALIQHDNLLDVQNFIERRRIRILEMEWVDGYDLDALLALGLHQPGDCHGRFRPHAAQAWHGRGDHPRVPGRNRRAAS